MTFSISELACASSRGSVLIRMAWFGISSAACFSSPRAARAEIQALRTAFVSKSASGGRGARSLKGRSGCQPDVFLTILREPAMAERYVDAFDESMEYVEKNQYYRHVIETCRCLRHVTCGQPYF